MVFFEAISTCFVVVVAFVKLLSPASAVPLSCEAKFRDPPECGELARVGFFGNCVVLCFPKKVVPRCSCLKTDY